MYAIRSYYANILKDGGYLFASVFFNNFHGRFEYIPIQSMEKAVEVIVRICENYAKL